MSWNAGAARRVAACAVQVLAGVLMTACMTVQGEGSTHQVDATSSETRDHITASDESEALRRSRVRMELAAAYFGRGQLTTALDEVKLAITADPTNAAAFNLRGLIYASLGDDALAEDSFRRALQLAPRDADTMQNFGWYLCQKRRYAEADTMFQQALEVPQYRDSPRTLLTRGVCQARAGQLQQAEESLMRSYAIDPANPATSVNLTEVLYRRGEYERARFHIRRLNSNTDLANAETLWLAARIEKRLGNVQGVQDFGTQLRSRFPQSRQASAFERGQFDE
jgi:type IV pilus assembly protein PilF